MIPFKLFYAVYLRYFVTITILSIPCYYLFELVTALYKVNIPIAIIFAILLITCFCICYKWILGETLLEDYKKINVKTKFTNISWKFTIYSFCIETITSILTGIVFDFLPALIGFMAYITVDYFVTNFWLERYAKLEIIVKENTDQNNDIQS